VHHASRAKSILTIIVVLLTNVATNSTIPLPDIATTTTTTTATTILLLLSFHGCGLPSIAFIACIAFIAHNIRTVSISVVPYRFRAEVGGITACDRCTATTKLTATVEERFRQ
jgi:hypothetical protein